MADPGNESAEFSPAELDRLEDALERWTADIDADVEAVPEDSLLAPPLRARLAAYREVMTMTRAELPLEEVPDGLLAGVLAEAARTVPNPLAQRREQAPAGPGLWERLRRSMLLPGFALAGSAALLLWMVQPDADAPTLADAGSQSEGGATARLSKKDESPSPAAAREPELDAEKAPGGAARAEKPADEPMPPPPSAGAPQPAPTDSVEDDAKSDAKAARSPKPKSKKFEAPIESYPGLDDIAADAADAGSDKEALRDTLEQADAARRKGRCDEAMSLYFDAMGMSGPASERAQARAGYGLCLQSQGNEAKASKYFETAGKLSPGVDAWIKRERGDGPAKKAPAKPSAKVDQGL